MASAASSSSSSSTRPPKPPVVQPSSGNAIIINSCQRLNPVLECIRNVSKEFGDIVPDFQLGRTTCALFLSLKYHRLHPEYIHQRIERLGHAYNLRILLLLCDISEHQDPIRELTKTCLINNVTIVVAWTPEEAGLYLSTYKVFEHKPPDIIKERTEKDYNSMFRTALTSISRVNKTDVESLRTSFGSFSNVAKATPEQLQQLPGFGQVKVRRIKDAFEKPFRNNATSAIAAVPSQPLPSSSTDKGKAVARPRDKPGRPFGSAADMPPPPPPSPPISQLSSARQREPSPDWDIELDLNNVDDGPLLDTSVEAGEPATEGSGEEGTGIGKKTRNEGGMEPFGQKRMPPSPVWDIELDLNDSD